MRSIELWDNSGVSLRHKGANISDLTKHKRWSSAWSKAQEVVFSNRGILALIGDRGNGKTQMAIELIRVSCRECRSAKYARARDIGMDIRESYKATAVSTEQSIIRQYSKYDLLIIDELQERPDTEFEMRNLTMIIDNRYSAMLPTVLIANMNMASFMEHVRSSVVDRIHEGGLIINFDWPSFRRASNGRKPAKRGDES